VDLPFSEQRAPKVADSVDTASTHDKNVTVGPITRPSPTIPLLKRDRSRETNETGSMDNVGALEPCVAGVPAADVTTSRGTARRLPMDFSGLVGKAGRCGPVSLLSALPLCRRGRE
jgi:hypothetical protein